MKQISTLTRKLLMACVLSISSIITIPSSLVASEPANTSPLRFIAAVEIPLEAKNNDIRIGGLSSLYYDDKSKQLYAITDDKGRLGGPVLHQFNLTLTESSLKLVPSNVVTLLNKQGELFFPEEIIDAEAFDRLANGHWLVSSEGIDVEKYFEVPVLLEFNPEGRLLNYWPVDKKYHPKQPGAENIGIRPNDAFEGLSLSPDKNHLFLMNEKALQQDGSTSVAGKGSLLRLVKKVKSDSSYKKTAEYVYQLSELPNPTNSPEVQGVLSVSDILALSDSRLLVVEKSFLTQPGVRNTVRLHLASISDSSTNVSSFPSLATADFQPIEKKLWIDLDDFAEQSDFPKLDNIEGIIFGPILPNGNRSLVLVTDNNFSARQKTLFYAFEIITNP